MLSFLKYIKEDNNFEKKHPRYAKGELNDEGHPAGGKFKKKKKATTGHKHVLTDWEYEQFSEMLNYSFPNVTPTNIKILERPAYNYNCIAKAFGDTNRWWWPYSAFWPEDCLVDYDINESFYKLLDKVEAREIDAIQAEYRKGYATIAIYKDRSGEITHAALITAENNWLSKLGPSALIEHSIHDLNGGAYGEAEEFYKIPLENWYKMRDMQ